jgi:hypothetical protein
MVLIETSQSRKHVCVARRTKYGARLHAMKRLCRETGNAIVNQTHKIGRGLFDVVATRRMS